VHDVLIFFHVLGAFLLACGTAAMAPFALGLGTAGFERVDAARLARIGAVLSVVGGTLTLILGLWLVANVGYDLLRFWILGALVLWAIAGFCNSQVSSSAKDPDSTGVQMMWTVDAVATALLLVLMLWKPGA
jgi:uncharacterized membrane protein